VGTAATGTAATGTGTTCRPSGPGATGVALRGVRAGRCPIADAVERGSTATVWPLNVRRLAGAVRSLRVRQLALCITSTAGIWPLRARQLALRVARAASGRQFAL
jgi:hypothetical protein